MSKLEALLGERVRRALRSRRLLPLAAVICLTITLITPLWRTLMVAPQYHGDEALLVQVWSGWVTGDLNEIETLNQYVGVHLPLDTPELHATPWVIGFLLLLALGWLLVPPRWSRLLASVLLVSMIATAIAGTLTLKHRLYQLGHERDKSVFARVEDFTPPIFGSRKIANFTVHTRPQIGAWTLIAAGLLAVAGAFAPRRPATSSPATTNQAARIGAAVAHPRGAP